MPASTELDSEAQPIDIEEALSPPAAAEEAAVSAHHDPALAAGAEAPGGSSWRHWFNDKPNGPVRALVAVLAICAIAEGLVIGILLRQRWAAASRATFADVQIETPDPGASVMVDGRSAGLTPLQLKIGAETRSDTGSVGRTAWSGAGAERTMRVNGPMPITSPVFT